MILTLAGVMARPRGVREWIVAVVGALAMLAVGALTPLEAREAIAAPWNVLLSLAGLSLSSAVAVQCGVLAWVAGSVYRLARGWQDILFLLMFVICIAITSSLSKDATILLFMPLIIRM